MEGVVTYRLFISPQTHIRTVKAERWLFSPKVTDKYLKSFGKKKYDERVSAGKKTVGSPNNYLNRKYYVLKYFDYKRKLKEEADKVGLKQFPLQNVWIKFFIPMPKSWSKKKRDKNDFQLHTSRPDADNYGKAIFDSLLKEDKMISDFRVSKFWYSGSCGYIEIEVGGLPEAIGYKKIIREDKIK